MYVLRVRVPSSAVLLVSASDKPHHSCARALVSERQARAGSTNNGEFRGAGWENQLCAGKSSEHVQLWAGISYMYIIRARVHHSCS